MEDDGEIKVAVDRGVAVPGEVLAAGEDVVLLQALEERDGVAHHGAGIAAEGAVADDRVRRVGVDVEDRREIEVESDGAELHGDGGGGAADEIEIVEQAELAHRRQREEGRGHARDAAALLIDADERGQIGGSRRADRLAEARRGGDVREVAAKEDRPAAAPFAQRLLEPRRERGAVEPADEELTAELGELEIQGCHGGYLHARCGGAQGNQPFPAEICRCLN